MRKILSVFSALVILSGVMTLTAKSSFGTPEELKNMTREDVGASVSDNFYCAVNFERFRDARLPYDKDMILRDEDWTVPVLRDMLKDIAENRSSYSLGSDEQKIADCYMQLTDTAARDEAGIDVLIPIIDKIAGAADINELAAVSAEMMFDYGAAVLMPMKVTPGKYDSSVYHAEIHSMNMPVDAGDFFKVRGAAENVQRAFRMLIEEQDGENAAVRAKNVTDLLIEIAGHVMSSDEIMYHPENYREYDIDEFQAEFTADISPYTNELKKRGETTVTVADADGVFAAAEKLTDENLQAWKDYLTFMLLFSYQDVIPEKYVGWISPAAGPVSLLTEERAADMVIARMSKEFDFIFASEYADESRMESAREFTAAIIDSYKKLIANSADTDDPTKERFLKKLENCTVNINVPSEPYAGTYQWIPAEKGGGYLSNTVTMNSCSISMKLDKLGTAFVPDEYDWDNMPSYTFFNACYAPGNYVTIPYATICDPFFSPDASRAYNSGRLGFIIGHELSHAFDSTCMNYNENGCLDMEWISSGYRLLLSEKEKSITELYNSQKLFGIYPVNGQKTLSENMADIAGMQCMLSVLDTVEEKKEFMETFADGWYTYKYDSTVFEQINDDVHSPEEFRVNTVLSQMDDFYEVYGVTEGRMYFKPDDRRRVW